MLLKSFFFNLYSLLWNFSFYLIIILSTISVVFVFINLRKKFIIFILLIIVYGMWGFLLDLDGIILVFFTAEFTIFLIFIMSYLQLYGNFQFISSTQKFTKLLVIMFFFFINYSPAVGFLCYTSFYKALLHVVSSDFFILYYFLFEKLPLLVILLTLIISFFSLFFIIMYFSLKLVKISNTKLVKNIYFLRKQNLYKQTSFSSKLYTFQK